MKRILALFIVLFLLFPQQSHAHAGGLFPFLRINGSYPDIHPLKKQTIVPPTFVLPEDLAKGTYLVNEPIKFVVETTLLPKMFKEDGLEQKMLYQFDFGDGTRGEGTEVEHTYKTPGSKILTIYTTPEGATPDIEPQQIEQVQINVVPFKGYILPEPDIVINNKVARPTQEVVMGSPISLQAKLKNTPSTKIVSYAWDLGEKATSKEQKLVHTYTTKPAVVTPVLKVTDENGLVAYTFTIMTSAQTTQGYTFATNTVGAIILGVQGVIALIAIIWFIIIIWNKKRTKRS